MAVAAPSNDEDEDKWLIIGVTRNGDRVVIDQAKTADSAMRICRVYRGSLAGYAEIIAEEIGVRGSHPKPRLPPKEVTAVAAPKAKPPLPSPKTDPPISLLQPLPLQLSSLSPAKWLYECRMALRSYGINL
jgi:hypothetical protein